MLKVPKIRFPNAAVLAIAAGMSLATAPAKAFTVYYTGCAGGSFCTMDELFQGGTITVDEDSNGTIDKMFNSWEIVGSSTSFPSSLTPPSASNIEVSAYDAGPLDVGLKYNILNNDFQIDNNNIGTQFLGLEYRFKVIPSAQFPLIGSTYSLTNATTSSGGSVPGLGAVVIAGALTSLTNGSSVNGIVSQSSYGSLPTDIVSPTALPLASKAGFLVDNNIAITTISSPTSKGTAKLKEFRQTFSQMQVPEPGTIVGLLAFGGLCLVMKRNKF